MPITFSTPNFGLFKTQTISHMPQKTIREQSLGEQAFKSLIVWLILTGKTEIALQQLAEHYATQTPKLKVGLPKGHKKHTSGCYNPENKTIFVLNSDILKNPFVILHEFYHHIRTGLDSKHKGTEKYANDFAQAFIQAYKKPQNP